MIQVNLMVSTSYSTDLTTIPPLPPQTYGQQQYRWCSHLMGATLLWCMLSSSRSLHTNYYPLDPCVIVINDRKNWYKLIDKDCLSLSLNTHIRINIYTDIYKLFIRMIKAISREQVYLRWYLCHCTIEWQWLSFMDNWLKCRYKIT